MTREWLQPLLNPRSIALLGSTDWTDAVAIGADKIGFRGEIWRVHPRRESTAQKTYYRSVDELPGVPDCAFLAIPAQDAPAAARALAARGCGALVGFSSGFSEIGTAQGAALSEELRRAAGTLPYLGPNCYGMVNFFDRVALWPDQVVGESPQRGVALICQSGTIALTLMFNDRSLPIGYLITVGNQERLAAEDLIAALCTDARVTAIGLYLEGIKDVARFAKAAHLARESGKPIAIIKSGRSAAAARTAHSHTGAMTGSDAVFDAFCLQAGIARCQTLAELCETLKLLHAGGPLAGRRVIVMGCSGGDMAMTADLAEPLSLEFPAFDADTAAPLRALLGDRVTIANPFDIHTYTWFDHAAMRQIFGHVFSTDVDAVAFMLDCPPPGRAEDSAFVPVIDEFIAAAANAGPRAALLASLPETLNHSIRTRCIAGGVVPLQGLEEGLKALQHGAAIAAAWRRDFPVIEPSSQLTGKARLIGERAAKTRLAEFGLSVPAAVVATPAAAAAAARSLGFPVAMKITGGDVAHKSDRGGVVLNIRSMPEAELAARQLGTLASELLIEKMVEDGVAEILVGVVSDPQFGQVLVIGGGGVQAELWKDMVRLLPPWSRGSIGAALPRLKCWPLLCGFRGMPPADSDALTSAVLAIAGYASAHRATLVEMDVNPVIVCRRGLGAIAVDALIREIDATDA
jgi:acetate---CoA ligase (ADP-forming)